MLGQRAGFDVHDKTAYDALVDRLKSLSIAGPFFSDGTQLYLPCPLDVAVCRNDVDCLEAYGIRPLDVTKFGTEAGCDLPRGLQPAAVAPEAPDGFKPDPRPAFLRADLLVNWLLDAPGKSFAGTGGAADWPDGFLAAPEKDVRMHVQLDYDSGAGKTEGGLFQSVGLDLSDNTAGQPNAKHTLGSPPILSVRVMGVEQDWLRDLDMRSPLGGERRLVRWQTSQAKPTGWECPSKVCDWLEGKDGRDGTRIRMMLATPGIFADGWKPEWLETHTGAKGDAQFIGQIPDTNVVVRLVAACVDRWRPISGWGYEHGKVGPKPVQRLVPAGSVYFLQLVTGDVSQLGQRWLQSVCDDEQNQCDGFGLAVWGNWQEHQS
jgi:CRISPR-associated protein Cmr3